MGIEIIPISSQSAPSMMSTSITITPIAPKSGDDRRDRKTTKSSRDDKEKKRKRKRDDSPMGPPEKVPLKQDPLCKPVSVSIKPAESPPLSLGSTPTSPSLMRKFSPSPTSNRQLSLSGKLSPSLLKPKSSGHHSPSPKSSPGHVPSSPKHGLAGISSPKHPSASGSGKPSMSTLKNAASSPSSKNSGEKSKGKEGYRDKDRSRGVFVKNKSSFFKMKPLDLNITESVSLESLPSPSSDSKGNPNSLRNRKGSLSAIVDKLNFKVNAQHSDVPTDLSAKSSAGSKTPTKEMKSGSKMTGDAKGAEYMVKTSSDGMKLTINKPRTKENKSGGFSVGNQMVRLSQISTSPKVHTGLKPGVTSGPASKKPQQLQKSSSSSSIPNSSTTYIPGSIKSKLLGSSSSSSSKQLTGAPLKCGSKPSVSPKLTASSAADFSRNKDRFKPSKSSSEKSIFSSMKDRGKGSPTSNDSDSLFKMQSKVDPYTSALMMEGMIKTLDKKFQIPKLSDKKKNEMNNVNRSTVDTKILDMIVKNDIKYPLSIPAMNSLDQKIRNNMGMVGPGKTDESEEKKKEEPQNLSGKFVALF